MGELVNAINELILAAIIHGGDLGGAYFSNAKELREKVNRVAEMFDCDVVWEDSLDRPDPNEEGWPRLVYRGGGHE